MMNQTLPHQTSVVKLVEAERWLLQLGWYDPVRLHGLGHVLGLRGTDFADPVCGTVYTYLWRCADLGVGQTYNGALEAAAAERMELTEADLDGILFVEGAVDAHFEDYGRAVRYAAVQRSEAELQAVARDALYDGWIEQFNCWRQHRRGRSDNRCREPHQRNHKRQAHSRRIVRYV